MKLIPNPIRLSASLHKMLPNTMRHLYAKRPVKFFQVYTLGSVHVVYVEGFDKVDVVMTHDKRTIKDDEVDFVIDKLFPDTARAELTVNHGAKDEIEREVHHKLKVKDIVIIEKALAQPETI